MSNYITLTMDAIPVPRRLAGRSWPDSRPIQVPISRSNRTNGKDQPARVEATPDAPSFRRRSESKRTDQVPGSRPSRLNYRTSGTPSVGSVPSQPNIPARSAMPPGTSREHTPPPNNATSRPNTSAPTHSLDITFSNEGKLSRGKLQDLVLWCKRNSDFLVLSEGAWRYRALPEDPEISITCPLSQSWGGVAIIGKSCLMQGRKCKLFSSDHQWSITCCFLEADTILVGGYITPQAAADATALSAFLECIRRQTLHFPKALVVGDWNSKSGSWNRTTINTWAAENHLLLQNAGMTTHFSDDSVTGTDLDLIFSRNLPCYLKSVGTPRRGHRRLTYTVSFPAITIHPKPAQIQWSRLRTQSSQYRQAVSELVGNGVEVSQALAEAGERILGHGSENHKRIPRRYRRLIRIERRKLKRLQRGTEEYRSSLGRITGILNEVAHKSWRAKLTKLCQKGLGKEAWRLARSLARPPTLRTVGIPDDEFALQIDEVFNTNSVSNPDWNLAIPGNVCAERPPPWFTYDELETAVRRLPPRKAPGIDGVPYDAFKFTIDLPEIAGELLTKFNRYLVDGFPQSPIPCKMIGLPKPNGEQRPLSLLPSEHKLLEKMIMNRINEFNIPLNEAQSGFRAGMSPLRSLLTIDLAIRKAIKEKTQLFITSYDVYRAFDQVPKELLGRRIYDHISPFCPALARLAAQIMQTKIQAHIGTERRTLSTGAPQGSILAPRAFVAADDGLCELLPNSLVKYCDDNTTLTATLEERENAEITIRDFYAERGSKLNENKTRTLAIQGRAVNNQAIDVLGASVTRKGVRLQTRRSMFLEISQWIHPLTAAHGLTALQGIELGRCKVWAKLAFSIPISMPSLEQLTLAWIAFCRIPLNCYKTSHRLSVLDAIGTLNTPHWWATKAVIRFYRTAMQDPLMRRLIEADIDRCRFDNVRTRVDEYLAPADITWQRVVGDEPISQLLGAAEANLKNWFRTHMDLENERLGHALRLSYRTGTAKYLSLRNGKYGFPFLQESLNPPQQETMACVFCGAANQDCGSHLSTDCPSVPSRPNVPREAMELSDNCSNQQLAVALAWMKAVWLERKKLRERTGTTPGRPLPPAPPSRFLRAAKRKRCTGEGSKQTDAHSDGNGTPKRRKTTAEIPGKRPRPRTPTEIPQRPVLWKRARIETTTMCPNAARTPSPETVSTTNDHPMDGEFGRRSVRLHKKAQSRKSIRELPMDIDYYNSPAGTHDQTTTLTVPPQIPAPPTPPVQEPQSPNYIPPTDGDPVPRRSGRLRSKFHGSQTATATPRDSPPKPSAQTTTTKSHDPHPQTTTNLEPEPPTPAIPLHDDRGPRRSARLRKKRNSEPGMPANPLPPDFSTTCPLHLTTPPQPPTDPIPHSLAPPPIPADDQTAPLPDCTIEPPTIPHAVPRMGKWTEAEDSLLLLGIQRGLDLHAIAALVSTRETRQVRSRTKTLEFKGKLRAAGIDSVAAPDSRRRLRWSTEELSSLLTVLNTVGNCHDFMAIHLQHPSRSIAGLTSKINKLVAEAKLIQLPDGSFELV